MLFVRSDMAMGNRRAREGITTKELAHAVCSSKFRYFNFDEYIITYEMAESSVNKLAQWLRDKFLMSVNYVQPNNKYTNLFVKALPSEILVRYFNT